MSSETQTNLTNIQAIALASEVSLAKNSAAQTGGIVSNLKLEISKLKTDINNDRQKMRALCNILNQELPNVNIDYDSL